MSNIDVELNYKGLLDLFKSPEIREACEEVANRVAETAGEGYNVSEYVGPHRAGAAVWCNSPSAIKDNMENNTFLKALGSTVPGNKIVNEG